MFHFSMHVRKWKSKRLFDYKEVVHSENNHMVIFQHDGVSQLSV